MSLFSPLGAVVEFMLNEADTRIKLIDPKLHESGWGEEFVLGEKKNR